MDSLDLIRKLQKGERYTLCAFTGTGKPYYTRFALHSMRFETLDYGDTYTLKAKAKISKFDYLKLDETRDFIIWEGSVSPDITIYKKTGIKDYDSGIIERTLVYGPFDVRYLMDAKRSVYQTPLIYRVNEDKVKGLAFPKTILN